MRGRPPAGRADGSAALASRELKTLRERDVRLLLPDGPDAVGGGRAHYDAFRSTTGTLMLVPHLGARTAPATVVRRLRGWRRAPDEDVTVAGREPLVPALVAAAGVGRRVREVLFEPDPRRRAAFVLERANGPVVL
jgi:hypothetical protein